MNTSIDIRTVSRTLLRIFLENQEDLLPAVEALKIAYPELTLEALSVILFDKTNPLLVRCKAADYLAKTNYNSEQLYKQMLTDPDSTIRWNACGLASCFGDDRLLPYLYEALLRDIDPGVRVIAARTIGAIGTVASIPFLESAFQDISSDWEERSVRDEAMLALSLIKERIAK